MDDFKSKRCLSGLIWMLATKTEAGIKEREEKSAVSHKDTREELGRKNGKIFISSCFYIYLLFRYIYSVCTGKYI